MFAESWGGKEGSEKKMVKGYTIILDKSKF